MSNSAAAQLTIESLRSLGRLEDADEAQVALVLALAAAVDAQPDNASLFREYRAALNDLRTIGASDADHDQIAELIAAIRGGAEVGDTTTAGT